MPKTYKSQSWFENGGADKKKNGGVGGVFGWLDDTLGSFLFGDPQSSTKLYNDLTGFTAQQAEFEQQEYLMDKQNEYNTPANQMARMQAAGINPNTAAAAIAGGGSLSAQPSQVATNTQGTANALQAVAGGIGSLAGAKSDVAEANRTNELVSYEANKMSAETCKALEDAGLSHWSAMSISTLLPYQTANQKADFYLKLAQYDNCRADYQNILANHNAILQDIELKKATISQMDYQNALIAEDTRWKQQENDHFDKWQYRSDVPNDVALRQSIIAGNGSADSIGQAIEISEQKAASGQFMAEEAYAYNIAYLREQGKDVAESLYGDIKTLPQFGSRIVNRTMQLIDNTIMPLIGQGKIKEARKEITEVLNNCYVGLEEHPEDAAHYNKYIKLCTDMLSANNEEFKRLYELWQSGNVE